MSLRVLSNGVVAATAAAAAAAAAAVVVAVQQAGRVFGRVACGVSRRNDGLSVPFAHSVCGHGHIM